MKRKLSLTVSSKIRQKRVEKFLRVITLLTAIATVLMLLICIADLRITPGGTFHDASEPGQECTAEIIAVSDVVGTNLYVSDMCYYIVMDTDKHLHLVLMDDAIYEQCQEQRGDVVPMTGYSVVINQSTLEFASEAANYVLNTDYYNSENVQSLFGDFWFVVGSKVKSRTQAWRIALLVILVATIGCVFVSSKSKFRHEEFEDNYEKGRKKTIIYLICATVASIGFYSGWGRLGLLYIVAASTMSKYDRFTDRTKKFVCWSSAISYCVGHLLGSAIYAYINSMREGGGNVCAIPFTSIIPELIKEPKILIGMVLPVFVIMAMYYFFDPNVADNGTITELAHKDISEE